MSPFDEARYARLLEGLEIAEVRLSQLEFSGRLDSEYYRPSLLRADEIIKYKGGEPLESLCDFVIGPFGSAFTVENYTDERTYRYIRGKDVKPMALADDDNVYMPKMDFDRLSKYALRVGDVLVSVVGTLGNSALIESQHLPSIFSCKSTALRTRGIDPRYLVSYLNCDLGRGLLMRKERGAVQKGLNLDDLKSLAVYVAGRPLQLKIAEVHKASSLAREQAKQFLSEAETVLLHSLGLDGWKAPDPLTYLRSSRDAFGAGRLDAEHFKPKYDELIERLQWTGSALRLGPLLETNDRGNQPEYADNGLPVVNSKHVIGCEVRLDDDNRRAIKDAAKLLIEPGDLLMNGTGVGTIGRSATYLHSGPAIPDNHVTVLRPKLGAIDPIYLSIFINSLAGQLQVEQRLHGSSGQIELYPSDIAEFTVWVAPNEKQREIRRAAEGGFALKRRAAQLIEAAKRAVEIAIEQDEKSALTYLEAQA